MEETTIARPIKRAKNTQVFTFTHRQMWYIQNRDPVIQFVAQPPTETNGGNIYWRNQFRTLPIRALQFWVNPGELALFTNFTAMKFLEADISIHQMSFRSQFITGSAAVGYANSNMQLHGLVFENPHNDLLPHNIFLDGQDPVGNAAINGVNLQNDIWPSNNALTWTTPSQAKVASLQFKELGYTTWYHGGVLDATSATGQTFIGAQNATYQYIPEILAHSQLIGRKVTDWNKTYNLSGMWGGEWISIRPYFSAGSTTNDFMNNVGAGAIDGNAQSVTGLLNLDKGTAEATSQIALQDMWIIPPDPLWAPIAPRQDAVQQPSSTQNLGTGIYTKDDPASRSVGFDNLQLAVEHLFNQDGSVVPAIMDFYVDTNISVEVSFDYGTHHCAWQTISIPPPEGSKDQPLNIVLPQQWQAVNNRLGLRRTVLTGRAPGTSNLLYQGFGQKMSLGLGTQAGYLYG